MSEAAQLILVAIVALLVGAVVPVLISLRATLRRADRILETLEGRIGGTLNRVDDVLSETKELAGRANDGIDSAQPVLLAAQELVQFAQSLQRSAGKAAAMGAAVAPAIIAAVHALRKQCSEMEESESAQEDELDFFQERVAKAAQGEHHGK